MPNYTEEQKKRIEANRLRALRIRSEKAAVVKTATAGVGATNYSKPQTTKPLYDTSNNIAFSSATSSNKHPQSVLQCTVIEGNRFSVTCSYNMKLVSAFKSIPSRRYDSITKKWNFSLSDHGPLGSKIKSVGFQLSNPENAVIVKSTEGGSTSVGLNDVNQNTAKCSGKCYLVSSSRFEVEMPYHKAAVAVFKSLSTKLYDINSRRWNFDLCDYNLLISSLKKEEGLFLEPLPSTVLEVFKSKISGGESKCPIQDIDLIDVDPKIVSSLMPFQKDGVNFAISKNGRVLLADDMGLGKTVQSICVASYYRSSWPLLVVCPSSVRLMWKESLLRWLPTQLSSEDISVMLTGKDSSPSDTPVTIISYDLLTRQQTTFERRKYKCVIVDESHFIKNFKTARARSATAVLKHAKHILLLSGTPALSRPSELYTQLAALRADLFPYFHQFGLRYCNGKQNTWGWDYGGSSNMEELRLILQETVMLRRTKEEVLLQLPPKLRRTVALDVSIEKASAKQRKILEASQSAVTRKGISAAEKHGILLQYFNETAEFKLPAVRSYVLDLLEGGHKFLLFAHHKSVLDAVETDLTKKSCEYIRIDGSTPSDRRQTEVTRFQEKSSCKVALLSITAANMGITLNAASLVVFAELFWNPGDNPEYPLMSFQILVQAEDRCYRIGQRDVVNVHYLIAKKTADDCIWQMIKNKLEVLSQAGLNKTDFNETQHKHVTKQPGQKNILDYFEGGSGTNDNDACDAIDEDLLRALEEAEQEEMTDNDTPQSNRFRPDQTDLNDVDVTKQSTAEYLHDVTSDSSRLEQSSRKRENLSTENDDFDAFREPKRLKK